jgi:hypothetical protein
MKRILAVVIIVSIVLSMFPIFTHQVKGATVDISAQYSTFVSAFNNYMKIFGEDVAIGQTVDRTLSGMINDSPAHYSWHSWAGQTYPDPPDGFSIRIETIQPDYVYKIIGMGFLAGSQPSSSGWIQVNSPFKIEQTNYIANATWSSDGSYVRIYINDATGRIDFSSMCYTWPALIDSTAFTFAITIAKPSGTLPPFSYDTSRFQASHTYDTDTGQIVMFGGTTWNTSDFRSDLWTFDPATSQWTSTYTGSGPSGRVAPSMSYNPVAKNFLVFGGGTASGETSDTWTFQFNGQNAGTWTQLAVAGPSARSGAPMVFDSKNNLFVLFGGEQYVHGLGDTWTFDPSTSTWTNKNPSTSPPERARAAMAYDAKSGKVLLFGGLNKGIGSLLGDTWLYDVASNTWQQVATATAPSARQWPSLASDGNGVLYLFGGWRVDAGGGLGQYLDDTWKFDTATMQWTQLSPPTSPIGQSQGAFMYIGGSRFILINGWRDSPLGDVWFFDSSLPTWSSVQAPLSAQLTVVSAYGSPTPTTGTYSPGTSITASVTSPVAGPAGTQYVCTGWTGMGDVPATGTVNTVIFTITQDSSITWNWKTQYLLTVLTNPSGLGPQPARNPAGEAGPANGWWYDTSVGVTLTAQSVTGYNFNYWDTDGASQGNGVNPITVNMNAPHTVTAHYTASIPILSVSISPLSPTISVGQSVPFSSSVAGGTPPYSYQWYLGANPVSGATSSSWTFTPTSTGTDNVYLIVTDNLQNTKQSNTAQVTTQPTTSVKYTIIFYTDPSNIGSITFAGTQYTNGQSGQYAAGPYSAVANAPSGWSFDHWVTTGGVSISSPATITGDGTVTAVFKKTVPPQSVGGEWAPITMQALTPGNTLQMLAPWIALALIVAAIAVAACQRLLKKHRETHLPLSVRTN